MDFIKKHYEKVILSVVLLGLVGALALLPFIISSDRQKTEEIGQTIISGPVKPLPNLDLTQQSNSMARLESPTNFDFSTTNKLFNPVEWKKTPDGRLIKWSASDDLATVTKITPLYFILTLDSVETNGLTPRYVIGVERQAAPNPALRRKQQRYASAGEKKDAFTITAVQGAPENPDQLILKLADTGETVTISKDKPFQRADAYTADLKYDLEKKNFLGRREGATISFGGEDYIIVAIRQNEVIISAASNQKRTTLRYAP